MKVELHNGCSCCSDCCYCYCCSCSHHFTPTGKWFSTGYWREQVKQQAYSSSLFVLWHHGVYPAPQRHGSLLWAVAQSHGGGQGMAAYWHPHSCPLNTLGERKAGSLLGWQYFESWKCSSFAEDSRHILAFFAFLYFHMIHIWLSIQLFTLMPYKGFYSNWSWTGKDRTYSKTFVWR